MLVYKMRQEKVWVMPETRSLSLVADLRPVTVTDQVYETLYADVVNLTLMPGAKMSEAEIAARMGVSRQPVRDAFYRLSQLGFIKIRPQRATIVTPLSEDAVMRAYFIRNALEEATMRRAADTLTKADLASLDQLIACQQAAANGDRRSEFHALDDQFHHDICCAAGLEFAWTLVKDNKGHMDRARYLSLSHGADAAVEEHRMILATLRARDGDAAVAAIRFHLSRIGGIMSRLRVERPDLFG